MAKNINNKKHSEEVTARFVKAMDHVIARRLDGVDSRHAFAKKIGEYPQNFSKMEQGTRYPTLDQVHLICKLFDVDALWLLLGIGEMFLDQKKSVSAKVVEDKLARLEKRLEKLESSKK
jgi:transcriptional regulator with XRE-family HTH domain